MFIDFLKISSIIIFADVNECSLESLNDCQQVCDNTPGSYTCSCSSGYALNADGICEGNTIIIAWP